MIQVVLHLADSPVRPGYDEALTSICEEECGHNQFKVRGRKQIIYHANKICHMNIVVARFMFVAGSWCRHCKQFVDLPICGLDIFICPFIIHCRKGAVASVAEQEMVIACTPSVFLCLSSPYIKFSQCSR